MTSHKLIIHNDSISLKNQDTGTFVSRVDKDGWHLGARSITGISDDTSLAGDSATKLVTEHAAKGYTDAHAVPLDPTAKLVNTNTTAALIDVILGQPVQDGAIQTEGGIFCKKNLVVTSTTNATEGDPGSVYTLGGISVAKDIYCTGHITNTDQTDATIVDSVPLGTTTHGGSVITEGGLCVTNDHEATVGVTDVGDGPTTTYTAAIATEGGMLAKKDILSLANLRGTKVYSGSAEISGDDYSDGLLKITNTHATAPGGYIQPVHIMKSNMGLNERIQMNIGRAKATKDLGGMGFHYDSTGSNDNCIYFGFYNTADLVNIYPNGNMTITGTLAKGGGSFVINHPTRPNYKLRHCFVETNTRGDNIYRYLVTISDNSGLGHCSLPAYYSALNENTQVFVSTANCLASAYGVLNEDGVTVDVHTSGNGDFNVMVVGTRKDQLMKDYWDEYKDEVPYNPPASLTNPMT